ncbi:MAG TPA: alpha-mannosidase [Firmicutes bacterium]|nr:alpha-mannosidase [Bacillota bacterium]
MAESALNTLLRGCAQEAEKTLQRFEYQAKFVQQLVERYPEHKKLVESATAVAREQLASGVSLSEVLAQWEEELRPLDSLCKAYTIHYVGHAHIDMNWMWDWPETVDECYRTFTTVLKLMEEFPQLTFSQSQAVTYWTMDKYAPEVLAQIKEKVAEGRWEITANTWVEGDRNISSGEAIVRQILQSKQFIKEKFGIGFDEIVVDWEPDTFGHAATTPEILQKAGIKYYYFCRCNVNKVLFWWEGPQGARVLTSNKQWYNHTISPEDALEVLPFEEHTGLQDYLVVYGVGDHGGGPTRRDILKALEMQQWPLFPTIKFSTVHAFFEKAAAKPEGIPVHRGELNYVFPGCYTSQSNIKYANRKGELISSLGETYGVMGHKLGDLPYPAEQLQEAWRNVLFNQFHDILPGSGVRDTYLHAQGLFQETRTLSEMVITRAKNLLASQIDTQGTGTPIVVWNPSPWTRTDTVTFTLWDVSRHTPALQLRDPEGNVVPVEIIERGHWFVEFLKLRFVAKDVPAMGWRVYQVEPQEVPRPIFSLSHWERKEIDVQPVLENEFFRIQLSKDNGGIVSLYDKKNDLELSNPQRPLGVLEHYLEAPHGMSSWAIGPIAKREIISTGVLQKLSWQNMPAFQWEGESGGNKVKLTISLPPGIPRVDFDLEIDWREVGSPSYGVPGLCAVFPLNLDDAKSTREIPFGYLENPRVSHDLPAQKWFNVSGRLAATPYNVALFNDCKYGHNFHEGVLRLNLLRSSYDPDPVTEQGRHRIRFALYPYAGSFDPARVTRMAYDFNLPLAAEKTDVHGGSFSKVYSFLSLEPENVMISALKLAEDGQGVVLRLYETAGVAGDARIQLAFPVQEAYLCDFFERKGASLDVEDNQVRVPLKAHEVVTIYLK